MYQVACPTCFKMIPAAQSYEGTFVCECGQKVRTGHNSKKTASASKSWIIGLGLAIIASFIHTSNWDNFSVEIVPLKVKQILGMADFQELRRIADICENRKKSFCQESALIESTRLDPKNKDLLLEISQIQMDRSAFESARLTLNSYFQLGGKDRLARYNLAIALWKLNMTADAKKHLKYLVFSSKQNLDAQAARSYVNLLMSEGDMASAHKVIQHCRSLGNNTAMFLEKEWKEIQARLNRQTS